MIHPILITPREDGAFDIMWLKKDAKSEDTYFEGTMHEGHPLFNVVQARVGMLNIANTSAEEDTELAGIGIIFRNGLCTVQLNDEEHAVLCEGN